jgi:hypothetical protein
VALVHIRRDLEKDGSEVGLVEQTLRLANRHGFEPLTVLLADECRSVERWSVVVPCGSDRLWLRRQPDEIAEDYGLLVGNLLRGWMKKLAQEHAAWPTVPVLSAR